MVINFGAGPAKLPPPVLATIQAELLSHGDSGMSVLEMSHRGGHYKRIHDETKALVRQLLNVPVDYEVLFFQGGGTGLFAAICMNLMQPGKPADYVVTGSWSSKAAKEALKYGTVNRVLESTEYGSVPPQSEWKVSADASYLYYCDNETVDGVEFQFVPVPANGVPLVADMSSNIFTRPVDVKKFGLIYAGAQKNIGAAGVALVIIRKDLIGKAMSITPSIWDFAVMAKEDSIQNTPPTFSIYVMGCVLKWIKEEGGVEEMERRSATKSQMVYDQIEKSGGGFYVSSVAKHCRSRMNIPFRIGSVASNKEFEKQFLEMAEARKMIQLKGHRSVGGIRTSLYNAMSVAETTTFVQFMAEFEANNHMD